MLSVEQGKMLFNSNYSPAIVYHYCNLDAFFAIIKETSLRLTNISKSNDSAEIKYCLNTFKNTLIAGCKEFLDTYVKNDSETDAETKQEIAKTFYGFDYDFISSKAVQNDSLIYYATCFSSEADLLSQWRCYANDGKGVAIGFRSKYFQNARDLRNTEYGKVYYNFEEKQYELRKYLIEKLQCAYKNSKNKLQISSYMNAINEILSGMVYKTVFFKNPAFKEESEWRFVYYPFGNIKNLKFQNPSLEVRDNQLFYEQMMTVCEYEGYYEGLVREKLSFRCTENNIISYVDLNFRKIMKEIIAEIIIGPKSDIDDRELRLFLLSNGYDLSHIKIKKSSATYR